METGDESDPKPIGLEMDVVVTGNWTAFRPISEKNPKVDRVKTCWMSTNAAYQGSSSTCRKCSGCVHREGSATRRGVSLVMARPFSLVGSSPDAGQARNRTHVPRQEIFEDLRLKSTNTSTVS